MQSLRHTPYHLSLRHTPYHMRTKAHYISQRRRRAAVYACRGAARRRQVDQWDRETAGRTQWREHAQSSRRAGAQCPEQVGGIRDPGLVIKVRVPECTKTAPRLHMSQC
jgi:hypothetical protein